MSPSRRKDISCNFWWHLFFLISYITHHVSGQGNTLIEYTDRECSAQPGVTQLGTPDGICNQIKTPNILSASIGNLILPCTFTIYTDVFCSINATAVAIGDCGTIGRLRIRSFTVDNCGAAVMSSLSVAATRRTSSMRASTSSVSTSTKSSLSTSTTSFQVSSSATSSSSSTSTASASAAKSSTSNTGAIAGGVIGGIAALVILILAIIFWRRRKRSAAWNSQYGGTQEQLGGIHDGNPVFYGPNNSRHLVAEQEVEQVPLQPMENKDVKKDIIIGRDDPIMELPGPPVGHELPTEIPPPAPQELEARPSTGH